MIPAARKDIAQKCDDINASVFVSQGCLFTSLCYLCLPLFHTVCTTCPSPWLLGRMKHVQYLCICFPPTTTLPVFFFFFNFGTFWYIFLLVITWFVNTMNATFSSIQRRALSVILLEDTFFPWLLRVFEECLKGLLYPLKSPVSLWHLRKPCWHCARAKSSSSGYHGPPLHDSSGWGSQQAASLGISVTAHRCRMQLQHYPGSDSTKPSTASSW